MSAATEATKATEKAMGRFWKEVLQSNTKILGALDDFTGLGTFSKEFFKNQETLSKSLEKAGYYATKDGKTALNYGKIAGGYLGVSAGARVLTGGGLYRDKNGNANIIGVPFI